MNRVALFLILVMLLCVLSGCADSLEHTENTPPTISTTKDLESLPPQNCRLIIQGVDISNDCYVYLCDAEEYGAEYYAQLPLTAIIRQLGGTVSWVDSDRVSLSIGGQSYIFDYSEWILSLANGDSWNYLAPPPGTQFGLGGDIIENEILIDSNILTTFFRAIGYRIRIDCSAKVVYIDERMET